MASDAPARVISGYEAGTDVQEYIPSQVGAETVIPGDFWFIDTADLTEMKRCGTDPILIGGISEVDSEAARVLTANGRIPLRTLSAASNRIALYSATTPVYATHVGTSYGITRNAGGHWLLDIAKTTTDSRMMVVGVNLDEAGFEYFICQIHQNILQFADLLVDLT